MAAIVRHEPTGRNFVLLGTGYGAYRSTMPGLLGGALFPDVQEGEIPLAAVCDARGAIHWLLTEELTVLEIDGVPVERYRDRLEPSALRQGDAGETAEEEACPACGAPTGAADRECPSCGLTLILEES